MPRECGCGTAGALTNLKRRSRCGCPVNAGAEQPKGHPALTVRSCGCPANAGAEQPLPPYFIAAVSCGCPANAGAEQRAPRGAKRGARPFDPCLLARQIESGGSGLSVFTLYAHSLNQNEDDPSLARCPPSRFLIVVQYVRRPFLRRHQTKSYIISALLIYNFRRNYI